MKIFLCTLLFSFMLFPNGRESSPILTQPLPRMRAHIENVPNLPICPKLVTRDGRVVGIYYNGKINEAKDIEPVPRTPPRQLPQVQVPSDGASVYHDAALIGVVRGGEVYDVNGRGRITPQYGDYAIKVGDPTAVYAFGRFHIQH